MNSRIEPVPVAVLVDLARRLAERPGGAALAVGRIGEATPPLTRVSFAPPSPPSSSIITGNVFERRRQRAEAATRQATFDATKAAYRERVEENLADFATSLTEVLDPPAEHTYFQPAMNRALLYLQEESDADRVLVIVSDCEAEDNYQGADIDADTAVFVVTDQPTCDVMPADAKLFENAAVAFSTIGAAR